MARRVTAETIEKITLWECGPSGPQLAAYDDATGQPVNPGARVRGTLTIGVGHTGPDVTPGLRITRERAEALLAQDLNRAERAVEQAVKVTLSDRQFGALVSFAFNVGTGAFAGSTLLKKLNRGDYGAVPAELGKWTRTRIGGKSVTSPGLIKRRALEAEYWSLGSTGAPALLAQQGAVAEKAAERWLTPESIGSGAAALGAFGGIASGNGPVQIALALIALAAFGIAAWYFITRRLAPK